MSEKTQNNKFNMILGPGLLFAATSVGVSHIIQSTRAGAEFGLGLLLTVLLVNFIKYPAFSYIPFYNFAAKPILSIAFIIVRIDLIQAITGNYQG